MGFLTADMLNKAAKDARELFGLSLDEIASKYLTVTNPFADPIENYLRIQFALKDRVKQHPSEEQQYKKYAVKIEEKLQEDFNYINIPYESLYINSHDGFELDNVKTSGFTPIDIEANFKESAKSIEYRKYNKMLAEHEQQQEEQKRVEEQQKEKEYNNKSFYQQALHEYSLITESLNEFLMVGARLKYSKNNFYDEKDYGNRVEQNGKDIAKATEIEDKNCCDLYSKLRHQVEHRTFWSKVFHPFDTYNEKKLLQNVSDRLISKHGYLKDGLDTIYQQYEKDNFGQISDAKTQDKLVGDKGNEFVDVDKDEIEQAMAKDVQQKALTESLKEATTEMATKQVSNKIPYRSVAPTISRDDEKEQSQDLDTSVESML